MKVRNVEHASEQILCVAIGEFGEALAYHLNALRPEAVIVRGTEVLQYSASELSIPRIYVLAMAAEFPKLCDALDELGRQNKRPFISVTFEEYVLRIGPVFLPGGPCCWRCWTTRRRQHGYLSQEQRDIANYCEINGFCSPKGYLETLVLVGAGRVIELIDQVNRAECDPGQVWELNAMTRTIQQSKVVGVDGCSRCGISRNPQTRSVVTMQQELAEALRWPARNI